MAKRQRDDDAPARIAVIGAGGWAQGWHLPNLSCRSDAVIAAIVDASAAPASVYNSDMASLAQLSEKYGAPAFDSLTTLLSSGVAFDGIICSTPHATHTQIGLEAIAAHKHILMEKPLTTDVGEARALYDAALAAPSLAFLVNITSNWRDGSLAAADWVRGGRVGEVTHVSSTFACPLRKLFEDPTNKGWTQPTGSMKGNGFGWGQLTHSLAWVYRVTGLRPVRVYAACAMSPVTGADLRDVLTVTCEGGATISATGIADAPPGRKIVRNEVFGTQGMLTYSGSAPMRGSGVTDLSSRLELRRHDGTVEQGPPFAFEWLEQTGTGPGSLDALVNACRGQPFVAAAGALEGLRAVATVDAMYRSALSGSAERVAEECA